MNPRSLDSTVLAELRLVFVHDCTFALYYSSRHDSPPTLTTDAMILQHNTLDYGEQ